jgi:CheY-like chemotaxis protein
MKGLRVLLVEDEGLVAMLIEDMLDDCGCVLACSVGTVAAAMKWLDDGGQADAALLDVNLGGEAVWPVAEVLMRQGVPFAFTTGYGQLGEPRFDHAPLLGKPVSVERLEEVLRDFAKRL